MGTLSAGASAAVCLQETFQHVDVPDSEKTLVGVRS